MPLSFLIIASIIILIIIISNIYSIINFHIKQKKCSVEVEAKSVFDNIIEVNETEGKKYYGDLFWEYYYQGKIYKVQYRIMNGVSIERYENQTMKFKINPDNPNIFLKKGDLSIVGNYWMFGVLLMPVVGCCIGAFLLKMYDPELFDIVFEYFRDTYFTFK